MMKWKGCQSSPGQGPCVTSSHPPSPHSLCYGRLSCQPHLRGQVTAVLSALCHNQQGHERDFGNFRATCVSSQGTSPNVRTSQKPSPQKTTSFGCSDVLSSCVSCLREPPFRAVACSSRKEEMLGTVAAGNSATLC